MSETRCFEKVTGRVVQRWQISREGIRCHMSWGRVGGRQLGQTMTLGNEAHAERHFKKKISEKKREGYVEVNVDPVIKPVRASAEAMADASLFDVMLEEKKHLYSRDYAGVPVEGRERVFVTFLNNLNMPEESLYDYLVLSADERRGVQFIVKNRGHDLAHMSAFLDFVCPRVDLAFDGRSHHKIALPSAVGQFGHVLFCAPSLCHNQFMGRLGMVFPIFDCEIGDQDTEVLVDARFNSRASISFPFTTWDREPFPVIDMKFDLHSENGFKELGGRTPFREKRFKVYPRETLEQTLRILSVATAGSRLEIRNYRSDVLMVTPANLTRGLPPRLTGSCWRACVRLDASGEPHSNNRSRSPRRWAREFGLPLRIGPLLLVSREIFRLDARRRHRRVLAFLADQREHVAAQSVELRRRRDLDRAWPRNAHVDALLDPSRPRSHDADAIGEQQRLLDVVRDEEHRLVVPLPDLEQQLLHQHARLRIEAAEGLVHQQHRRLHDEHTCDADALAHAARQFRRIAGLEPAQPDLLDDLRRAVAVVGGGLSPRLGSEHHVFQNRQPRKERRLLEHDGAARRWVDDLLACDPHGALRRAVEAGDHIEQG